jgi:hypothetical protein
MFQMSISFQNIHQLKTIVEEVLNDHFGEIELVVVLKSLGDVLYFGKILSNFTPSQ